jgi:hypothetical protein
MVQMIEALISLEMPSASFREATLNDKRMLPGSEAAVGL